MTNDRVAGNHRVTVREVANDHRLTIYIAVVGSMTCVLQIIDWIRH
jgi:hypothetical protein